MSINQEIKNRRLQIGLTQKEAAPRIGIHVNHLCNLERGNKHLNALMIERILATYEGETTYEYAWERRALWVEPELEEA